MSGELNLVKLCVGAEKVSDLVRWRNAREAEARANGIDYTPNHITRMWPRREAELLDGGSLYWVFKGLVLARQRIVRMDEVIGEDGIRRCALIFEHDLMLTEAHRRRPFQGWRYLTKADAPKDIGLYREDQEEIPGALRAELSALGIL
ncbi:lysophospholipase [Rhodobacterales bacterium 52_120_T64]|nr:lysophospholipase [Rhodobacterales bacterium 52_120_T64]